MTIRFSLTGLRKGWFYEFDSYYFRRGYSLHKVQENVECEIMQTILDEARESYDPNIVQEIRSETYEDLEQNVSRVAQWLEMWKADHVNE